MEKNKGKKIRLVYTAILLAALGAASVLMYMSVFFHGYTNELLAGGSEREEALNEALPFRDAALLPSRLTNSILDRKYYPDKMYLKTDSGQLTLGSPRLKPPETAENVKLLYDLCKENDCNFLYVLCPGKPVSDDDLKKYSIPCYRNEGADLLMAELKKNDVPYIDLRDVIKEESEKEGDPYAMFYKSDYHWTADAGLIAARTTANELERRYSLGLDTASLNEEKMRRTVMDEEFVGEMGEKVLGEFSNKDHLIKIEPVNQPVFHYRSFDFDIDRKGGFDIIFNESVLKDKQGSAYSNKYYYYMQGNDHLGYIENAKAKGNMLLVCDSFSRVVIPYLALTTGKIEWWDMRHDTGLLSYIKEHPEIENVVVIYNISFSVDPEMNDFK